MAADSNDNDSVVADELDQAFGEDSPEYVRIHLTNYLSFKSAVVDFGDFVALVGPNASGKSNAVAAVKLLREIAEHGLPIALARRGGFDQLRHRSSGRPYDPKLRLDFRFADQPVSHYEISLGAVRGGRYRVKTESAKVYIRAGEFSMQSDGQRVRWNDNFGNVDESRYEGEFVLPPGQSGLVYGGTAGFLAHSVLRRMRTVEINPQAVRELQDPSSTETFEPDGSNASSVLEGLARVRRHELVEVLASVVPGIVDVDVLHVADKQILQFKQHTSRGNREFSAKQVSDGTLRSFAILLAATSSEQGGLLVVEEPEIAVHLGALRVLVEALQTAAGRQQILITTHSADIVDAVPVESLRVVWSDDGQSRVAHVASHTIKVVRSGLVTPGQLLRSDSLDPEGA